MQQEIGIINTQLQQKHYKIGIYTYPSTQANAHQAKPTII